MAGHHGSYCNSGEYPSPMNSECDICLQRERVLKCPKCSFRECVGCKAMQLKVCRQRGILLRRCGQCRVWIDLGSISTRHELKPFASCFSTHVWVIPDVSGQGKLRVTQTPCSRGTYICCGSHVSLEWVQQSL